MMFASWSVLNDSGQVLVRPRRRVSSLNEEGRMELLLLIPVVAITALVATKIARRRANRPESPSAEVIARLEALERELAETQERLDFAERMLTKAREERRIGS